MVILGRSRQTAQHKIPPSRFSSDELELDSFSSADSNLGFLASGSSEASSLMHTAASLESLVDALAFISSSAILGSVSNSTH